MNPTPPDECPKPEKRENAIHDEKDQTNAVTIPNFMHRKRWFSRHLLWCGPQANKGSDIETERVYPQTPPKVKDQIKSTCSRIVLPSTYARK